MTGRNKERLTKIRHPDNFKVQTRNSKLQYAEFAAYQETPDAKGLCRLTL